MKTQNAECNWCGGPPGLCHCDDGGSLSREIQALAQTMAQVETLTESEEDGLIAVLTKTSNDVLEVIVAAQIKHLDLLAACVLAVRALKVA